jgi:hypothetical protein
MRVRLLLSASLLTACTPEPQAVQWEDGEWVEVPDPAAAPPAPGQADRRPGADDPADADDPTVPDEPDDPADSNEDPPPPSEPPGDLASASFVEVALGSGGGQGALNATLPVAPLSPPANSACATYSISPIAPVASATTWVASPPRFAGNNGIARPAELLLLDDFGCLASFPFTDADSQRLSTGFGMLDAGVVAPAGLMLRLVEIGTDLLLFSNAGPDVWRYQPTTNGLVRFDPFGRPVHGAAADGPGAWVVLAEDSRPAELQYVDRSGAVLQGPFVLPFAPFATGFMTIVPGGTVSMFRSLDVTVGADGRVWILDSGTSALAVFDPAAQTFDLHPLTLEYPTAARWWNGDLLLVSGLTTVGNQLGQAPELWAFDEATGTTSPAGSFPAPTGGWNTTTGFARPTNAPGGFQRLQHWFDLEPVGSGLVLSDPGNERLLASP